MSSSSKDSELKTMESTSNPSQKVVFKKKSRKPLRKRKNSEENESDSDTDVR